MANQTTQRIDTRLAQAGRCHIDPLGAISVPIYQTAIFRHPGLGQSTGYDYSRTANPTRAALEQTMADLEGGCRGFAFASGMAAINTILLLLQPGDHLVVSEDLYGGTYRLLEQVLARFGLSATYVDTSDPNAVEAAMKVATRALLVETPSNPLMRISDLRALGQIARRHQALAIVDNTFMTPYLQRPLELGWDIVIHSASKYLAGHNDVVGGLVVVKEAELAERVAFLQNAAGAVLGPQDAWLVMRGMKTLALRLERAQDNATLLAQWLSAHQSVDTVYYPGLPTHAGYETQSRQTDGPGAMISFTVRDAAMVSQILEKVTLIAFAESLGGVESLITYPMVQTHADIPVDIRERLGITDRLLRLSVGIENVDDLTADLATALG